MLLDMLKDYTPHDDEEAAIARQLAMFLEGSANPYDRTNLVAHVVADAWIVNPARTHAVLVEHGTFRAWLSPGGHCDGSPDVVAAARREAEEETGLTNLKPLHGGRLFGVNVCAVRTAQKAWGIEPAHLHFSAYFAFEAPEGAPLTISHESTGLQWVALNDIEKLNAGNQNFTAVQRRLVKKTLQGI